MSSDTPPPSHVVEGVWRGYMTSALWLADWDEAIQDPPDLPIENLSPATLAVGMVMVRQFLKAVPRELLESYLSAGRDLQDFGHDFNLTRNGHGAGFWDRGLGDLGDALTQLAKAQGEASLTGCPIAHLEPRDRAQAATRTPNPVAVIWE